MLPFRSNCGPPSPSPSSGPFPIRNEIVGAVASSVNRWTSLPDAVSIWIVGGSAVNRTVRSPARIGASDSGVLRRPSAFPAAAATNAPSSGTAAGPPTGSAVIRTVEGLTDATAISTGLPAIVMDRVWPRSTPPENATPAPATPSRFST